MLLFFWDDFSSDREESTGFEQQGCSPLHQRNPAEGTDLGFRSFQNYLSPDTHIGSEADPGVFQKSNYVSKWNLDCETSQGKKLMITFNDDEVLMGTTQGYHPDDTGFFLYPADPESNNIRVFIINTAVKSVEEIS